jgi:hypothetical protein
MCRGDDLVRRLSRQSSMNLIGTWIFRDSPRAERASISSLRETQEVPFFCPMNKLQAIFARQKHLRRFPDWPSSCCFPPMTATAAPEKMLGRLTEKTSYDLA